MSDLLNIGSSAVRSYKAALGAIGENVANAETPGYSRRTVLLRQAPVAGASPDPIYRDQVSFGGVEIDGVQRAWDAFRATEARYAASAAGHAAVREQWLGSVETALGNGESSVGGAMTRMFNAGTALAAKPDDPLARKALLMAMDDVAMAFNKTASALQRVSAGIADAARLETAAINDALSALHDLNGTLRVAPAGSASRASLEDQRDGLIDFLAERLDISTAIAGDGTLSLGLNGAAGVSLLDGQGPAMLGVVVATDGRLSLRFTKNGTTEPLPVSSGRLAGLAQVASSTADRRAALDELAVDFGAEMNDGSSRGYTPAGTVGQPLFDISGGAAGLRLLATHPDDIAAVSGDGRPNGMMFALEGMRGPNGPEARWNALVFDAAQTLAATKAEAIASRSWRDNSYAALDEVTGVDLDREAAELLRFQQAYNGAARIIQVGRETVNAILDLF